MPPPDLFGDGVVGFLHDVGGQDAVPPEVDAGTVFPFIDEVVDNGLYLGAAWDKTFHLFHGDEEVQRAHGSGINENAVFVKVVLIA